MFLTFDSPSPWPKAPVNESLSVVTEGYVGKTKEIKKIEELFNQMIKKYNTEGLFDPSCKKLDESAEKKAIEKLLEKEFGFKSAEIKIMPSAMANAFTVPSSLLLRDGLRSMPTSLTAHGEKYYDEKHAYDFFMVLCGELFSGKYTGSEITGLMLHEVGHNFDVSTLSYIGDFVYWVMCFADGAILQPFIGHILSRYMYEFVAWLTNLTPISFISKLSDYGIKYGSQLLGPLGNALTLFNIVRKNQINLSAVINIPFGFSGERFADSFAAAYGYGPELMSALHKLDTQTQQLDKGFIVDTWTWSGSIAPSILCLLIDPHPETQTRAKALLEDMEKLANNEQLPKNIRAACKAEYIRSKKGYDLFVQVDPDQKKAITQRFMRKSKDYLFGGKVDLRIYLLNTSALQGAVSNKNRKK